MRTVDLDGFDLTRAARLRLDDGAWVAPTAWEAPAGGHHRQGTLVFATLDRNAFAAARTVELELVDVAAPSRVFRWDSRGMLVPPPHGEGLGGRRWSAISSVA